MKCALLALGLAWATSGTAAVDVDALWNFADPAATEANFRAALEHAHGDDALILRTQIARTLSLRQRFDEAQRELDDIEPALPAAGVEPRVRAWLGRGRTLRSSGKPAEGHNNIGSDLRDAKPFDESLAAFREALAAHERAGRAEQIRIARWQIANVLRLQGRHDEALAMQIALERDATAALAPDPLVYDELVLLQRAAGNERLALQAEARAAQLRKK